MSESREEFRYILAILLVHIVIWSTSVLDYIIYFLEVEYSGDSFPFKEISHLPMVAREIGSMVTCFVALKYFYIFGKRSLQINLLIAAVLMTTVYIFAAVCSSVCSNKVFFFLYFICMFFKGCGLRLSQCANKSIITLQVPRKAIQVECLSLATGSITYIAVSFLGTYFFAYLRFVGSAVLVTCSMYLLIIVIFLLMPAKAKNINAFQVNFTAQSHEIYKLIQIPSILIEIIQIFLSFTAYIVSNLIVFPLSSILSELHSQPEHMTHSTMPPNITNSSEISDNKFPVNASNITFSSEINNEAYLSDLEHYLSLAFFSSSVLLIGLCITLTWLSFHFIKKHHRVVLQFVLVIVALMAALNAQPTIPLFRATPLTVIAANNIVGNTLFVMQSISIRHVLYYISVHAKDLSQEEAWRKAFSIFVNFLNSIGAALGIGVFKTILQVIPHSFVLIFFAGGSALLALLRLLKFLQERKVINKLSCVNRTSEI